MNRTFICSKRKNIFKLIVCRLATAQERTTWTSSGGLPRRKNRSWHVNEIGVGSDGVWDVGLAIYSNQGQHTYLYVFTSRYKSVDIALNYKHANRVLLVFLCFIRIELTDTPTHSLIVFHIIFVGVGLHTYAILLYCAE